MNQECGLGVVGGCHGPGRCLELNKGKHARMVEDVCDFFSSR